MNSQKKTVFMLSLLFDLTKVLTGELLLSFDMVLNSLDATMFLFSFNGVELILGLSVFIGEHAIGTIFIGLLNNGNKILFVMCVLGGSS
jgi:hypothetical protein